jgi:hypothetical protein
VPTSISYDTRDVTAVIGQLRDVDKALRTNASAELRDAAGTTAERGVAALQSGARGTPQASIVAGSAKVKRDRVPAISIGGARRVGRRGTPAGDLVWGSEKGGRNFAAGINPSGYWIEPTIRRFQDGEAADAYRAAVAVILRRAGVL